MTYRRVDVEGVSRPRWLADRQRCRSLVVSPGSAGSAGDRPVAVPVDAEVDEPAKVGGGAAVGEPDAVAGDAAVANLAATAADEPGDRSFDHRTVTLVGLCERGGLGVCSGGGEQFVVLVAGEDLAVSGAGAALAQRAAVAASTEAGLSGTGTDRHRDPVRTGRRHRVEIDREVIGDEPVGDRRVQRNRFDRRRVTVDVEVVAELA